MSSRTLAVRSDTPKISAFLFDVASLAVVALAIFYWGQYIVYTWTTWKLSPPGLLIVAALGGFAAVPCCRSAIRAMRLNHSTSLAAVLAVCVMILLGVLSLLGRDMNINVFPLPLAEKTTTREEQTLQGTVEFREFQFRKKSSAAAEWVVYLALGDNDPKKEEKAIVVFFDRKLEPKRRVITIRGGEQPIEIVETAPYESVALSWPLQAPIQFLATASIPLASTWATATRLGKIAAILLPLCIIAILFIGVTRQIYRVYRYLTAKAKKPRHRVVAVSDLPPPSECWRFSKNEMIALGIGLFLIFTVRMPMLAPIEPNGDDVCRADFFSHNEYLFQGAFGAYFLAGRFTAVILSWFLYVLADISMVESQSAFSVIAFISFSLTGLYAARAWKLSNNVTLTALVVLFVQFHPYMQELLWFRTASIFFIFLPLAILAVATVRPNARSIIGWAICLGICFGAYQSFANGVVAVVFFALLFETVRECQSRAYPSITRIIFNAKFPERCLTLALGVFFYFVMGKCFTLVVGRPPYNYAETMHSLKEVTRKINALVDNYCIFYFQKDPVFNFNVKAIMLALIVMVFVGLFVSLSRRRSAKYPTDRVAIVGMFAFLFFAASVLAPFGSWIPTRWSFLHFRTAQMISLFWGGVFPLAVIAWEQHVRLRNVLCGIVCFVAFLFILLDAQSVHNGSQVVAFDTAKVNRIIADLEKTPGFDKVKRLCLIPQHGIFDRYDYHLKGENLTLTGFGVFHSVLRLWATADVINNRSGYRFESVWSDQEKARYMNKYRDIPIWPASGSIVIDGDTAVIRMGKF